MQLIETEWVNFRNAVVPKGAPRVQLIEMRRAFFAGSWALYQLMMNHLEPGDTETPADLDFMRKLDAEMRSFKERVRKGQA